VVRPAPPRARGTPHTANNGIAEVALPEPCANQVKRQRHVPAEARECSAPSPRPICVVSAVVEAGERNPSIELRLQPQGGGAQ
jgi:hypothetical protein